MNEDQINELKSLVDELTAQGLSTEEIQASVDQRKAEFANVVEVTDEIQTTPTEGKTNDTVETGAPAVSETGQAPESTESDSVDTSLESQPIDNSPEAIFKRRKQAALDQAAIDKFGEIELEEVVVTADDSDKTPEDLLENIQKIDDRIKILAGDNKNLKFIKPGEISGLDSPKRISEYNNLLNRRKQVNKTLNEKLKEEGGFKALYRSLVKGDRALGEALLSVPSFIYQVGSLVSDPVNRALGLPETDLKKFEETIGTRPLLDSLIEEQENLGALQQQYKDLYDIEGGIGENFKKGNWSDGFYLLGETLAESAPVSLSLMAGGAAGLSRTALTLGGGVPLAAGEMRTQLEEFPEDTKGEMLLKSTLIGVSEGFFEGVFGSGAVGKVYKNMVKDLGEEQAKKTFKQSITSMYEAALQKSGIPLTAVGGGLEEVGTQATQNIVNGKPWNEGLTDAFLTGVGGGALYGAPVNLSKGVQLGRETYQSIKADMLLKPTEFKSVSQAFATDVPTAETQIKLSQSPSAEKVLTRQLKRDVQKGNLTIEQANEIELNFRQTQGAVNQLKPLNLNEQDQGEIVELVKEKNKLQQEIKQVNEPALTEPQDQRVKEINDLLRNFSAKAKLKETTKIESIAKQIDKVGVKTLSTEEIQSYLQNNNFVKNQEDAIKKSSEGAFIIQNPETQEQEIIVNKDIGSISDPSHEALHALIFQTVRKSPDTARRLGESLQEELNKIDPNLIEDSGIRERLELYNQDPTAVQMEEVLTLFSDTVRNGTVKFNDNAFTKIGDFIRQFLSSLGVKAKFNNGRDVYNFIKDYNKSIESGKLTKGQVRAAKEGVTGKLVGPKIETFVETPTIKESKIYQEVETFKDDLINQETKDATAFLIADKLENEVDRRLKIDVDPETKEDIVRNFLFDDRRGLLGLLKNYDPARNESVMGYLNSTTPGGKLLDARLIEFYENDPRYNQIIQSTTDEAVQRKAEQVIDEEVSIAETSTKPEESSKSKLIDVRQSPRVKKVLPTLEKEIKLTEGDSSVEILNNNRSKFASEIYNIPEGKIEKVDNLTYSKNKPETSELGRIQQDFSNAQETERSIKTMPEFNVTTMESTITEQGERVPVSPEVRGRSMKIGQTVLDFFYEPYTDPASESTDKAVRAMAITNKSGRSKGKTTQTKVYRLKPEFRPNTQGKISPQAVLKAREWAGVDVDLNELSKNERRNYATKLAAWARMRGGQVALSVADKSLPESAPKQQRADTRAGRSRLMFSKNIDTNIEDNRFSQIYFAYERGEALSDKDKQIVEDYIAKQALEESDKGKSALQFTKAMKASDLPSNLKEGTWTLSDKKFKEDASALKEFDNQADNLSSQIPLTASIANKNRNIVLGLFAGHYNIVGSDMAKIGSDFKQGILSNLNTDESSVLSEETLNRWKKFPWENLKSSYASENYTGLRKINESNSFKEQQAIARETFNTKQGKASLELYDLWNTTLQEWLYSSEPGSKEFNDKANYILKLKKSNASIGTTGERILAPPGYVFLPGQAISGTVKFEHLKSSSQQSGESALLVLQNKWKDKGKDNIKAYNGIWGLLDDFNIIDEQTGKVNDSSIFRFAENLELAKSIYSVESNFTKTLYDDIVKKVGKKFVKQFESDQNKLFNFNNDKLPVTVKLSKSKTTPDVLETMESLDSKAKEANKNLFDSADLNKGFNDILEQTTGIASEKRYKRVKAEVAGAARGRVFRGIPYSAQDFVGLLYETLSKGKLGDAQMAWYQENLLKPYAKAMNEVDASRLSMMQDYRALKKELELVPKNLRKKIPGEPFTREQAVRVYIWNQQGMEVPGISESDLKDLTNYVNGDRELQLFANQLIAIQKGDEYAKPKEGWPAGSITTDLLENINTVKRAKYLEQWKANRDIIFSEENLNKLEAAYGKKYRKAMENMLQRMETGRNRSFSDDSLTGRFTDWLQGSVGAIMFFNTRSALLQTISAINFVNFTDNNPLAAAKAFANQKQYWSDFTKLINSDFLKARRSGLRMNVNEADIADMAKKGGPKAVINKLLQLGFAPTQIADSFAIASGGATFYRNRVKTYTKQGLSQQEAETRAFEDFRENAEESQQSARPDRISMQQAGGLGRLILAFQNTPSQYARIIDKSIRDLKNGRGDAKTNVSKIIYYSTVQNLLFNAIQQALFAFAFDDEESEDEKKKEKYFDIANGMSDSLLRGTGLAGGVLSVAKNAIIRIVEESEKDRPKFEKVGADLLKIAPPVSSKLSKINQAARSYQWDKKEMMEKGWSLDNPAYLAAANIISATTNIPVDRGIKKINNVVSATDSDLETWERLALLGGWQDWELNIEDENKTNKPQPRKSTSKFKKSKIK